MTQIPLLDQCQRQWYLQDPDEAGQALQWWWWYEWLSQFWRIVAHIKQKSGTCVLWTNIFINWPYILLSNLLCQLSHSSDRYTADFSLPSFSTFVYCLLPFVLRSRVLCLPIYKSTQLCSWDPHHHKATTTTMAHIYLLVSPSHFLAVPLRWRHIYRHKFRA